MNRTVIPDNICYDAQLNEAVDYSDFFALYVNDSWGVVFKKQRKSSTNVIHDEALSDHMTDNLLSL